MSRTSDSSGYQSDRSQTSFYEELNQDELIFPGGIEDNDVFADDNNTSLYEYLSYTPLEWALVSDDLKDRSMFVDFLMHLQNQGRSKEILDNMPGFFAILTKDRPDFAKAFYDIMFTKGRGHEALAISIKVFDDEESTKQQKQNASQMIAFLADQKGRQISKSFLNGKSALSYCKSDETREQLIAYFQEALNQPILAPQHQILFDAVENGDIKQLQNALAKLQDVNFASLYNEDGKNIFEVAFGPIQYFEDEFAKSNAARTAEILFLEIEKLAPLNYSQIIERISVHGENLIQLFAKQNCQDALMMMLRRGYCDLKKIKEHKFPYLFEKYNKATKMLMATAQLQDLLQQPQFDPSKAASLIQDGAYIYAASAGNTLYGGLLTKIYDAEIRDQKSALSVTRLLSTMKEKASVSLNSLEIALELENYSLAICLLVSQGKFTMPQTDTQMQKAVEMVKFNKLSLLQNPELAADNLNKEFRKVIAKDNENSVAFRLAQVNNSIKFPSEQYRNLKAVEPKVAEPKVFEPRAVEPKVVPVLSGINKREEITKTQTQTQTQTQTNLYPLRPVLKPIVQNNQTVVIPKTTQVLPATQGQENKAPSVKDLINRFSQPSPVPQSATAAQLKNGIGITTGKTKSL